jgi:cyclase
MTESATAARTNRAVPSEPSAAAADPQLDQVADGIFAYTQPDGGWCLNNAGVLVADGRCLLVDTAATERRTLLLREAVASVAAVEPNAIVNTHHHSDHTFGNSLFGPLTAIVAHEETRLESAAAGLGIQTLWPDVEWGEVSVRLPTVTFTDTLTLHLGDVRVELIHLGPAHTTNDTVVWIPAEGVLFTGDIAMAHVTPYVLMGSVAGSLAALDQLIELKPRIVVPGHGPVGGPEILEATRDYLSWVRDLDARAAAEGLTPLQAAQEADLGAYADLVDSERLVSNLHRARLEAAGARHGAPIDVVASFREMITYHGALPTCHA